MSEQERDYHAKRSEDTEAEDVEAHLKAGKTANAEDEGDDDVEAHVKSSKT